MTDKQRETLQSLENGPKMTSQVAELLAISSSNAHARLRDLEDKNYVRRVQMHGANTPIEWQLTRLGRSDLEKMVA